MAALMCGAGTGSGDRLVGCWLSVVSSRACTGGCWRLKAESGDLTARPASRGAVTAGTVIRPAGER
jgi:hypothetical protein